MANGVKLNGCYKVIVSIGVSLLAIAVAWGTVKNQVGTNFDAIEKKLDIPIFQMHCEQQRISDDKVEKKLDRIEAKLDKALEK